MRWVFCSRNSHCPFVCFPKSSSIRLPSLCSSISEDARHVSPNLPPVSPTSQQNVSLENIDIAKDGGDDGKAEDGGDEGRVEVLRKSSIRKSGSDAKELVKGRVQWMDFAGKDLVEIREIETNDLEEEEDHSYQPCTCAIQ